MKKNGFLFAFICAGFVRFAAAAHVLAVAGVAIPVSNLERSVDFYTQVLSFKKVSTTNADGVQEAKLQLGDESILLREYAPKGRPYPADSRSNDRWFQHIAIIVRDMDAAYAVLKKNNVRKSSPSPQRLPDWNKNAGGIKAFYFKDPDDHPLEILSFPDGKGNLKWHRAGKDLFLGIDHTAIVVSSTDKSLHFYKDELGLSIAGEGENYGVEQERLNNVTGAHLRITSLHAAEGPGIEFLEYLAPIDGRPFPDNSAEKDLVAVQTILTTDGNSFSGKDPDGHSISMNRKEKPQ